MRVNIITDTDVATNKIDAQITRALAALVLGKDTLLNLAHWIKTEPVPADLNLFLGVLTPLWLTYAPKNVMICNPDEFLDVWSPFLVRLDALWLKAESGQSRLGNQARFIGWTTFRSAKPPERKNFSKALLVAEPGAAVTEVLEAWDESLPELHLVGGSAAVPEALTNIRTHSDDKTLADLRQECGLYLGFRKGRGFSAEEAAAAGLGCIVVGGDAALQPAAIREAVTKIQKCGFHEKHELSRAAETWFIENHEAFLARARTELAKLAVAADAPPFERPLAPLTEFPFVSILTPTANRSHFMRLAKYCFMMQNYPASRMEWIIYDDGDDCCRDMVDDLPEVRYILDDPDPTRTVGMKRNRLCAEARGDILMNMDDDDWYWPQATLARVMELQYQQKDCVIATSIPMYCPGDNTTAINVPPLDLPYSQRASEACMAFRRSFWEAQQFGLGRAGEAEAFLRGREDQVGEFNAMGVMVALQHRGNTGGRSLPPGMPRGNGCAFNFDKMFDEIQRTCAAEARFRAP
jgi:hypothetical protein